MLSHLLESWSSLYANHAALRTAIEFMHIGGLVAGGGCAITADLATMTAAREDSADADRTAAPAAADASPRRARAGGAPISGLLLFAADVETFLYSRIFWLKMGLMGLLLINGALLLHGERQVTRGETTCVGATPPHRGGQPGLVVLDDAGRRRASQYRVGGIWIEEHGTDEFDSSHARPTRARTGERAGASFFNRPGVLAWRSRCLACRQTRRARCRSL